MAFSMLGTLLERRCLKIPQDTTKHTPVATCPTFMSVISPNAWQNLILAYSSNAISAVNEHERVEFTDMH